MNKQLDLIYRHAHPDYKSVVDGQKCILVLRGGEGTCLVSLNSLTEQEIADKLPYALKKEAEQLGRDAHDRRLTAAPALDKRCMELVADMNPSGTVGAATTTIIMEAWSLGWHAANAAVPVSVICPTASAHDRGQHQLLQPRPAKHNPMRLTFLWSGIEQLLDEVRKGTITRPTFSGEKDKGLWLVGDQGVYLMANTTDGPRAQARKPAERAFVVYAIECNPALPFEDWWEAKQSTFGGDDGCELIPLADIERMLSHDPTATPVALAIDFERNSFTIEITFGTKPALNS